MTPGLSTVQRTAALRCTTVSATDWAATAAQLIRPLRPVEPLKVHKMPSDLDFHLFECARWQSYARIPPEVLRAGNSKPREIPAKRRWLMLQIAVIRGAHKSTQPKHSVRQQPFCIACRLGGCTAACSDQQFPFCLSGSQKTLFPEKCLCGAECLRGLREEQSLTLFWCTAPNCCHGMAGKCANGKTTCIGETSLLVLQSLFNHGVIEWLEMKGTSKIS